MAFTKKAEKQETTLEPLVLKRTSNLSQYKPDSNIYWQSSKDSDDGEVVTIPGEEYRSNQILIGSMQNVTPHFDGDKSQWSFYGDLDDLKRIAKKLSLSDPKTRTVITVDESSLYNKYDPFWAHPVLWNSLFLDESSVMLEPNTPINELMLRIIKGREDIKQPDRDDQSLFDTERSNIMVSSPHQEKKQKFKNTEELTEAMTQFLELSKDEDKLYRVVAILDPSNYEEIQNNIEAIKATIQQDFVVDDVNDSRYGTTTRKQFLEVAKMNNTELEIYSLSVQARKHGIVRPDPINGASFKGEKIAGGTIKTDKDLFRFLVKNDNIKTFQAIEAALAAIQKVN